MYKRPGSFCQMIHLGDEDTFTADVRICDNSETGDDTPYAAVTLHLGSSALHLFPREGQALALADALVEIVGGLRSYAAERGLIT